MSASLFSTYFATASFCSGVPCSAIVFFLLFLVLLLPATKNFSFFPLPVTSIPCSSKSCFNELNPSRYSSPPAALVCIALTIVFVKITVPAIPAIKPIAAQAQGFINNAIIAGIAADKAPVIADIALIIGPILSKANIPATTPSAFTTSIPIFLNDSVSPSFRNCIIFIPLSINHPANIAVNAVNNLFKIPLAPSANLDVFFVCSFDSLVSNSKNFSAPFFFLASNALAASVSSSFFSFLSNFN